VSVNLQKKSKSALFQSYSPGKGKTLKFCNKAAKRAKRYSLLLETHKIKRSLVAMVILH